MMKSFFPLPLFKVVCRLKVGQLVAFKCSPKSPSAAESSSVLWAVSGWKCEEWDVLENIYQKSCQKMIFSESQLWCGMLDIWVSKKIWIFLKSQMIVILDKDSAGLHYFYQRYNLWNGTKAVFYQSAYTECCVIIIDEPISPSVDQESAPIPPSAVVSVAPSIITGASSPGSPCRPIRRQLSHDQGKQHVVFWG